MIPDGVSGQPLRLFFTEHLFVSLILGGDPSNGCCRDLFRVKDDSPEEIVARSFLSRDILLSGHEDGSFCVAGTQYYRELSIIDPSSFPIYFWLRGSKPWVP